MKKDYFSNNKQTKNEWPQVVWITGASSGLGLHTATALAANGFTVLAGARSFVQDKTIPGCYCFPLDVTDNVSIDGFVNQALKTAGPPDVLINCAGIVILGACESFEKDELRKVMETNFYGMAAMISHVLPLMREQKRGRIINFSSINGLLGIPFEGAYTASKHAIEGYSECLALETKQFGIEVMLVEPGGHRSSSKTYRHYSAGMTDDSPYKKAFDSCTSSIFEANSINGADPDKLGQKIASILKKRRLPRRLVIGNPKHRLSVIMHSVLPSNIFDQIIINNYIK